SRNSFLSRSTSRQAETLPRSGCGIRLPVRARNVRDPGTLRTRGFRFGCEKKALSLSVDLEPIEVIVVIAAALIRKYSQCSARHAPLFTYFPNFGNNWQQATENRLTESH